MNAEADANFVLTGKGGIVDTSLYETALGWMVYLMPTYAFSGKLPTPAGSGVVMISPYQAMRTRDSQLVIAAGNDSLFAKLATVLGHPEWITDERFLTNGDRVVNKPVLIELIEGVTTQQTTLHWIAQLEAAAVIFRNEMGDKLTKTTGTAIRPAGTMKPGDEVLPLIW